MTPEFECRCSGLAAHDPRFVCQGCRANRAIAAAVAARDMEWWEAVVLVDSVAPTPEAAKHFVAVVTEHFIAEAVAAERERVAPALNAALQTLELVRDGNRPPHGEAVAQAISALRALT